MKPKLRSLCVWGGLGIAALVLAAAPYVFMVWFYTHSLEEQQHLNQSLPNLVTSTVRALTWLPYQVAHPLGFWQGLGALFWDTSGGGEAAVDSYWSFSNPYMLGELAVSFAVYFALLAMLEGARRLLIRLFRVVQSPAKA